MRYVCYPSSLPSHRFISSSMSISCACLRHLLRSVFTVWHYADWPFLFLFSLLCVCVFQIFQSDYQKYHGEDTPSWCACQLTLEVFHEPVVTPCGISYEQGALMEHLNKVGSFDPVTRRPMTAKDIRKNVGLRNAVESYLNDNPWAWEHAM